MKKAEKKERYLFFKTLKKLKTKIQHLKWEDRVFIKFIKKFGTGQLSDPTSIYFTPKKI